MNSLNYSFIELCSPKAWEDFQNYYKKEFSSVSFLSNVDIKDIPFELQLGIYLKYFNKNGVELDVCNTDYELLPQTISDAFKNFEHVISHYS